MDHGNLWFHPVLHWVVRCVVALSDHLVDTLAFYWQSTISTTDFNTTNVHWGALFDTLFPRSTEGTLWMQHAQSQDEGNLRSNKFGQNTKTWNSSAWEATCPTLFMMDRLNTHYSIAARVFRITVHKLVAVLRYWIALQSKLSQAREENNIHLTDYSLNWLAWFFLTGLLCS